MSMLRRGACAVGVTVLLLSGCSGSAGSGPVASGASGPGQGAGASTGRSATAAAVPSGPCDRVAFAEHAGLATGAVHALVWKPFRAGAFTASAKGRATAMATGGRAGALASREFGAAIAVVGGCPSSLPLVNALRTGVTLSASTGRQLGAGTLNTATLGGTNSIAGTVASQAKSIGVTVTDRVPSAAQLSSVG